MPGTFSFFPANTADALFGDITGTSDALTGLSRALSQNVSALARVITGRRQTPIERLASGFLQQTLSGQRIPPPITPPTILPGQRAMHGAHTSHFRTSQGQMLAQMAAAITRASQRYL